MFDVAAIVRAAAALEMRTLQVSLSEIVFGERGIHQRYIMVMIVAM
jgi:hypothetical protein